MTAEIDLMESAVYIVKDGRLTKVTAKQRWARFNHLENGQVLDIDRSERVRIEGQDVIQEGLTKIAT